MEAQTIQMKNAFVLENGNNFGGGEQKKICFEMVFFFHFSKQKQLSFERSEHILFSVIPQEELRPPQGVC